MNNRRRRRWLFFLFAARHLFPLFFSVQCHIILLLPLRPVSYQTQKHTRRNYKLVDCCIMYQWHNNKHSKANKHTHKSRRPVMHQLFPTLFFFLSLSLYIQDMYMPIGLILSVVFCNDNQTTDLFRPLLFLPRTFVIRLCTHTHVE